VVPGGQGRFKAWNMTDRDCIQFLQWALPRLGLRWPGFRKVRRQVCKRVQRRLRALELADVAAYRRLLLERDEEWTNLDGLCRITISRFYRDRGVYRALEEAVMPALASRLEARGEGAFRVWSSGCASGEEAYSLSLLWRLRLAARHPSLRLEIVASDSDSHLLDRARRGCYGAGSLRDLPGAWLERGFERHAGDYCLKPAFRGGITWLWQDVREARPAGPFQLVLCRNLAFTYFNDAGQRGFLRRLREVLAPGGAVVVGAHERLPVDGAYLEPWPGVPAVYRVKVHPPGSCP